MAAGYECNISARQISRNGSDHEIGSLADEHYSFMGAADPVTMEKSAREVATV